jgi:Tfp pilus assembly protein PilN
MRRLNLDYRQDQRLLKYGAYLLMLICFLLATLVLIHYSRALSENTKLNTLIDKVEGVAQPNLSHVKESQLNPEAQKELIAYSNQVITKLNMPWGGLFQSLDSANSNDVALLGIEPNLKKGVIKLSGEAKNFKGLFDYMRALNAKSGMNKVYLIEHKISDQDPDQPVHFSLEASWISKP